MNEHPSIATSTASTVLVNGEPVVWFQQGVIDPNEARAVLKNGTAFYCGDFTAEHPHWARWTPYRLRVDRMRLNEAMNVIEFHDGDNDRWVVVGWFDAAIREFAQKVGHSIQAEMDRWNETFQQGDPLGFGWLNRL